MSDSERKKILLQVSGSIAAFKAAALASMLEKEGFEVRTVLSKSALEFVGAATFEGITGNPVHSDPFESGAMMAHIELERWADLLIVYPASAHTISSLAQGSGEGLIGQLFLAHEFKKPYLLAPAMNQAMWKHPVLQKNLDALRSFGVAILEPGSGALACGETGQGRLMEPEEALREIQAWLRRTEAIQSPLKILVTAGGTTEPIDEVRHLSNFSTGRTGHAVAQALQKSGHSVTLLQSVYSSAREGIRNLQLYSTTRDFAAKIRLELESEPYDFVIHAAAVADYHVESAEDEIGAPVVLAGKIQKPGPLTLKLRPNPKIIRELRGWSRNRDLRIISFKLTIDESTDPKLETYDSEWIIQNHLKDVGPDSHKGRIFVRKNGQYEPLLEFRDRSALISAIQDILATKTPEPHPIQESPPHDSFA